MAKQAKQEPNKTTEAPRGSSSNDYSTLVETREQWEDSTSPTVRKQVLGEADKLVNGDRNNTYGPPTQDFQRTADFWNIYLMGVVERKLGTRTLTPEVAMVIGSLVDSWDIAAMMNLLKMSRLTWSPQKQDHWVDIAGYSACGAECVSTHMAGEA
jgi:hypothetical protein